MLATIFCKGCDFKSIDIIAQEQHCMYCSSDDVTVEKGADLVQSRESILLHLALSKFNQTYSCLMHMAGENGFNASTIITKINDDSIWAKALAAPTLDELLLILGKPTEEERCRRPCVCPM